MSNDQPSATMSDPAGDGRWRTAVAWAVTLAAAVAGAYYGYGFGKRISGTVIGVILAANGAVFCSVLASAAAERLLKRRRGAGR